MKGMVTIPVDTLLDITTAAVSARTGATYKRDTAMCLMSIIIDGNLGDADKKRVNDRVEQIKEMLADERPAETVKG